jgi:hypothetical protein
VTSGIGAPFIGVAPWQLPQFFCSSSLISHGTALDAAWVMPLAEDVVAPAGAPAWPAAVVAAWAVRPAPPAIAVVGVVVWREALGAAALPIWALGVPTPVEVGVAEASEPQAAVLAMPHSNSAK